MKQDKWHNDEAKIENTLRYSLIITVVKCKVIRVDMMSSQMMKSMARYQLHVHPERLINTGV
jgi:hypothetical protein